MSDDKRLTVVEALRMAMESLAERRDEASNAILDCDRTVRIIDGALQRHEEESCQTESGASQHANSADTRSPSTSTHPKAHATSAASSVDASRAVESRTAIGATAHPSAPPSEPEAVRRARELATARNLGRGGFSNAFVLELLTHIDTISARLKMAEKLLGEIRNAFLDDRFGDYLNIVDAFLAGKGEA